MKNLYGEEPKLNLEEIFTNDEIKSLKKNFSKNKYINNSIF
jgi:hypothetical protein